MASARGPPSQDLLVTHPQQRSYHMPINRFRRLATATVLALAAMIVVAQPASAAPITLPAGVACTFPLVLEGGEFPLERITFTDPNGNPITVLAGQSGAVTYTNDITKESLTFRSRGTALRITEMSDGTQLLEFSGNVGIILFPTDVPAGPSTTQINGRLVMSFDPVTGFTVVLKQEGNQIDVCARLS
jgi:hypothetical protein